MSNTVKQMQNSVKTLFVLWAIIFSWSLQAEQKQSIAGFDVHFMAYNTAMLEPDVAKAYGIQRSKSQGALMISMIRQDTQVAFSGLVRGKAKNPIGQIQDLVFKKIQEDEAIYYLATFRFADTETLSFDLEISPEGQAQLYPMTFKQQFFVE